MKLRRIVNVLKLVSADKIILMKEIKDRLEFVSLSTLDITL